MNLPLYHLDKYFFEENWVEREHTEFLQIQESIVKSPQWIIDGNSIRSLEMRYSKADLVLYFNYSRRLCLLRVIKRVFHKNPKIDDRASGCAERVTLSLLRYLWNFEERIADSIQGLQDKYPHTPFIEIRHDQQLKKLKEEILS